MGKLGTCVLKRHGPPGPSTSLGIGVSRRYRGVASSRLSDGVPLGAILNELTMLGIGAIAGYCRLSSLLIDLASMSWGEMGWLNVLPHFMRRYVHDHWSAFYWYIFHVRRHRAYQGVEDYQLEGRLMGGRCSSSDWDVRLTVGWPLTVIQFEVDCRLHYINLFEWQLTG